MLNGIGASEGEVIVPFRLLTRLILLLLIDVIESLDQVLFDEISLHQPLYLLLLGMILLELVIDKFGEFLLLFDFDGTVKGVHISFHPYLLHMQVEDFLV